MMEAVKSYKKREFKALHAEFDFVEKKWLGYWFLHSDCQNKQMDKQTKNRRTYKYTY